MKKIISILLIVIILTLQVTAVFADESYYVQVGAFQSKHNAEKYTNYMISIGYDAVMIKVFDLYKVFLGPYDTEEKAREILADYKSVGGQGFFVIGSQMYYQTEVEDEPIEEEIEETVEEDAEETEETVEETEEAVEETDTEEANETEEAVETEEDTSDQEDVIDNEEETTTIEVKVIEQEDENKEEEPDYKLFTIILIVVLWVIFVISLVIFRLNQNRVSTK